MVPSRYRKHRELIVSSSFNQRMIVERERSHELVGSMVGVASSHVLGSLAGMPFSTQHPAFILSRGAPTVVRESRVGDARLRSASAPTRRLCCLLAVPCEEHGCRYKYQIYINKPRNEINNFFFLIYYIFIYKLFSIFFHYLDYNTEDISTMEINYQWWYFESLLFIQYNFRLYNTVTNLILFSIGIQ